MRKLFAAGIQGADAASHQSHTFSRVPYFKSALSYSTYSYIIMKVSDTAMAALYHYNYCLFMIKDMHCIIRHL